MNKCLDINCICYFHSDAKRLIGRRFDDSVVQADMKHWPFTVINDSSRPKVKVEYKGETKTFYPEEISSMVLIKMKEIAEAYLGKVTPHALLFAKYILETFVCISNTHLTEIFSVLLLSWLVPSKSWKSKQNPAVFIFCLLQLQFCQLKCNLIWYKHFRMNVHKHN